METNYDLDDSLSLLAAAQASLINISVHRASISLNSFRHIQGFPLYMFAASEDINCFSIFQNRPFRIFYTYIHQFIYSISSKPLYTICHYWDLFRYA